MKNVEVLFAHVKTESQSQGLEWMMFIPPESEADKACFIYLFYKISEIPVFDEWFENPDSAFKWAEEVSNVPRSDWKTLDDIYKLGIELDLKVLSFVQTINNKNH